MVVTLLLKGIPNQVSLTDLAHTLRDFLDTDDVGGFVLRDVRNRVVLDFETGYDAMISQQLLDRHRFSINDGGEFTVRAAITRDPALMPRSEPRLSPGLNRDVSHERKSSLAYDCDSHENTDSLDTRLKDIKLQIQKLKRERKLLKAIKKARKEHKTREPSHSSSETTESRRRHKRSRSNRRHSSEERSDRKVSKHSFTTVRKSASTERPPSKRTLQRHYRSRSKDNSRDRSPNRKPSEPKRTKRHYRSRSKDNSRDRSPNRKPSEPRRTLKRRYRSRSKDNSRDRSPNRKHAKPSPNKNHDSRKHATERTYVGRSKTQTSCRIKTEKTDKEKLQFEESSSVRGADQIWGTVDEILQDEQAARNPDEECESKYSPSPERINLTIFVQPRQGENNTNNLDAPSTTESSDHEIEPTELWKKCEVEIWYGTETVKRESKSLPDETKNKFTINVKKLLTTLKPEKFNFCIEKELRPRFMTVAVEILRWRLRVLTKDKQRMNSKEIMDLYRENYPCNTDKQFVRDLLSDVKNNVYDDVPIKWSAKKKKKIQTENVPPPPPRVPLKDFIERERKLLEAERDDNAVIYIPNKICVIDVSDQEDNSECILIENGEELATRRPCNQQIKQEPGVIRSNIQTAGVSNDRCNAEEERLPTNKDIKKETVLTSVNKLDRSNKDYYRNMRTKENITKNVNNSSPGGRAVPMEKKENNHNLRVDTTNTVGSQNPDGDCTNATVADILSQSENITQELNTETAGNELDVNLEVPIHDTTTQNDMSDASVKTEILEPEESIETIGKFVELISVVTDVTQELNTETVGNETLDVNLEVPIRDTTQNDMSDASVKTEILEPEESIETIGKFVELISVVTDVTQKLNTETVGNETLDVNLEVPIRDTTQNDMSDASVKTEILEPEESIETIGKFVELISVVTDVTQELNTETAGNEILDVNLEVPIHDTTTQNDMSDASVKPEILEPEESIETIGKFVELITVVTEID